MGELIKKDVECKSGDTNLGTAKNAADCAARSKDRADFLANKDKNSAPKEVFFIFGKANKAGYCFMEKTKTAKCKEGWEKDKYDFYRVGAPKGEKKKAKKAAKKKAAKKVKKKGKKKSKKKAKKKAKKKTKKKAKKSKKKDKISRGIPGMDPFK